MCVLTTFITARYLQSFDGAKIDNLAVRIDEPGGIDRQLKGAASLGTRLWWHQLCFYMCACKCVGIMTMTIPRGGTRESGLDSGSNHFRGG